MLCFSVNDADDIGFTPVRPLPPLLKKQPTSLQRLPRTPQSECMRARSLKSIH